MKKIVLLAALLFSAVLLMASCSPSTMSFIDYKVDYVYEDSYPILQTKKTVTALQDLSFDSESSSTREILAFKKVENNEKSLVFYNSETDKILTALSIKEENLVLCGYKTVFDRTFILLLEEKASNGVDYRIKLFDASGNAVATKELPGFSSASLSAFSFDNYFSANLDLFKFNGSIYRVNENGGAAPVLQDTFFEGISSFDMRTENYYYAIDEGSVSVCNLKLEEVLFWKPHYEVSGMQVNVLSSDKLLIQTLTLLTEEREDYDLYNSGKKFEMTSVLVDVLSRSEKELDLNYLVSTMTYNRSAVLSTEPEQVNESITDIAYITYIEDKRPLNDMAFVSLNPKSAEIKAEIAPEFDTLPVSVAFNRWLYTSDSERYYLIDGEGETVAELGDDLDEYTHNEALIDINGTLYNYNLEAVCRYENEGLSLVGLMAHRAILVDRADSSSETDTYYLFNGTSKVKIDNYLSYGPQYYITRKYNDSLGKYEYKVFNEDGQVLLSVAVSSSSGFKLVSRMKDNAGIVVSAVVNNKTTYYRITEKYK